MRTSALVQIYGTSAGGSQLPEFIKSNLTQHAHSLYNRATSINLKFTTVFTRDEFVAAHAQHTQDKIDAILARPVNEDFFLSDVQIVWEMALKRLTALTPCSEDQIAAALEVGMSVVAQRAAHEAWPYLTLEASGVSGVERWGICVGSERTDIETWQIEESPEQFLKYAAGTR